MLVKPLNYIVNSVQHAKIHISNTVARPYYVFKTNILCIFNTICHIQISFWKQNMAIYICNSSFYKNDFDRIQQFILPMTGKENIKYMYIQKTAQIAWIVREHAIPDKAIVSRVDIPTSYISFQTGLRFSLITWLLKVSPPTWILTYGSLLPFTIPPIMLSFATRFWPSTRWIRSMPYRKRGPMILGLVMIDWTIEGCWFQFSYG